MSLIPGVETIHRRWSWQPVFAPITGPSILWGEVSEGTAHHPGVDEVPSGDIHEHADDVRAFLVAAQLDYHRNRGYSLGYSWAVDWLGGAWEIRGWDLRAAANPGRKRNPDELPSLNANRWTIPVLYIVDNGEGPTVEACATGRAIYREARRRCARPSAFRARPRPHDYYDWTGCPGGVRRAIDAGLLDITYSEPAPSVPSIPSEEDDMQRSLIQENGSLRVFETDGAQKWWVQNPAALDVKRLLYAQRGWPSSVQPVAREHVAGFGPVVGPVPPDCDEWGRKL